MFSFPCGSAAELRALLPDSSELWPSLDNPSFPSFGKSFHGPLQNPLGSFPASHAGGAAAPKVGRKLIITHCRPGGPTDLTVLKGGGMLWDWAEPLLHCGATQRACGVGSSGTAMGHGAMLQRVGQFSASPSASSPGVWDVSAQSHALTRRPEPYSCLRCPVAFGDIPALCVPSAGASGLSSPGLDWAEQCCGGAEPMGPWVTRTQWGWGSTGTLSW